MKPRNLLTTKTLQGAFAMVIGFAIATAPLINGFVDRKFATKTAEDIKFWLAIVVTGGGFLRTAYGRYQATEDVFTPAIVPGVLPGRDKSDVEQTIKIKAEIAATAPKIHVENID
jgi:hypothetical protein